MRIIEAFLAEPIALHEPSMAIVLERYSPFFRRLASPEGASLLEQRVAGEDALSLSDFVHQRRTISVDQENGIATIHVNDVLARGLTNVDKMLGATDYNDVISEVQQALEDPSIRGVLIDANSPGGSVIGVPEAAQAVADLANAKPVVSYVEMLGASAMYYTAAASHAIVASPSAVVGSIGTISTMVNISGLLARFGVSVTHLTGGDLKASGTPYREMSRHERDFLQGRVDQLSAEFRAWVTRHRSGVKDSTMQGQWFSGSDAVKLGLVDQTGSKADAYAALRSLMSLR